MPALARVRLTVARWIRIPRMPSQGVDTIVAGALAGVKRLAVAVDVALACAQLLVGDFVVGVPVASGQESTVR
jgi:hypothetical protein